MIPNMPLEKVPFRIVYHGHAARYRNRLSLKLVTLVDILT